MRKLALAFLLCCCFCFSSEPFYYFKPPKDWKVVDPKKIPEIVEIGFVSNESKTFKASLNLVIEEAKASFDDYIASVKKHHLSTRKSRWSELGYVQTKSGKAHVSQIDTKAECGDIRSMQCIIKDDDRFYIITAVALRDEFIDYHNEFLTAFETFTIQKAAKESLKTEKEKTSYEEQLSKLQAGWSSFLASQRGQKNPEESFESKKFQKKHWKAFEKALTKTFKDQGLFWQVMAAKEAKNALLASSEVKK